MKLNPAVYSLCFLTICHTTSGQVVSFTNRLAQPNDTAQQIIRCDLDAERTIRQHSQVVDTSKQKLKRHQVRNITILKTNQGQATLAKVRYLISTTKVKPEHNEAVEAKQPVEGNTYLLARVGEELRITRENGQAISPEEDKILRAQLSTFGTPNPLSQFLHGQQIQVGDSIDVPDEVAAKLLGFTGNSGKTDKLTLKLTRITSIKRTPCAVFETLLRSHSDESSLSLLMKGELVIDPATCRTQGIKLQGPIAASERRGPSIGRFHS